MLDNKQTDIHKTYEIKEAWMKEDITKGKCVLCDAPENLTELHTRVIFDNGEVMCFKCMMIVKFGMSSCILARYNNDTECHIQMHCIKCIENNFTLLKRLIQVEKLV